MDIQARPAYQPVKPSTALPTAETSSLPAKMPEKEAMAASDSISEGLFALQGAAKATLNFTLSDVQLPDLPQGDPNRFRGGYVEQEGNSLSFYHSNLSTDNALFSLEARLPRPEDHARAHEASSRGFGQQEVEAVRAPKLRSPYLKALGKETAERLIRTPIEAALEGKAMTAEAGRGALIAGALVGAALYAGSDTKFSTRLAKTEVSGYDVSLKAGLSAGHGKVDMRSVGLSFRPQDQESNVNSGVDLKYDMEDKTLNLSYSRTVDYGGSQNERSIGNFNASLFHEQEKSNTGVRFSYHLNF